MLHVGRPLESLMISVYLQVWQMKLRVLATECSYLFCVVLKIRNHYEHPPTGHANGNTQCSLLGSN